MHEWRWITNTGWYYPSHTRHISRQCAKSHSSQCTGQIKSIVILLFDINSKERIRTRRGFARVIRIGRRAGRYAWVWWQMATYTHTHVCDDHLLMTTLYTEENSRTPLGTISYAVQRSPVIILLVRLQSRCNSHQNDDDNSQEIQYKFYSLWRTIDRGDSKQRWCASYLGLGWVGGGGDLKGGWKVIGGKLLSIFFLCTYLVSGARIRTKMQFRHARTLGRTTRSEMICTAWFPYLFCPSLSFSLFLSRVPEPQ